MLSFKPAVNLQIVNLLILPRATPRRRLRLYSKDGATFMLVVVIVVSVLVALGTIEILFRCDHETNTPPSA
jgi:hypothetical protein